MAYVGHVRRCLSIRWNRSAALRAAFLVLTPMTFAATAQPAHAGTWKVKVRTSGLYALDAPAANALGIQGDLNGVAVQSRGRDVPVEVAGDGAALWFYAQPEPTPYSSSTTYWISDAGAPAAYAARAAAPPAGAQPLTSFRESQREELQAHYFQQMPDGEGKDHWLWKPVMLKQPATFPVKCVNLLDGPGAKLSVSLHGVSFVPPDPDHHLSFALNGSAIGEVTWDGQAPYVFEAGLPPGILREGENELTVAAVEDGVRELDLVLVDYFVVEYSRGLTAVGDALTFTLGPDAAAATVGGFTHGDIELLDVTDPLAPVRLTDARIEPARGTFTITFVPGAAAAGARFYAATRSAASALPEATADQPSTLKAADNRADYIVIAPREFHEAAQPLVELHQADGLTVKIVAVEDVYDEFANGDLSPVAIRDFLAHAVKSWTAPAPRFVLLIGDGTFDYQDYMNKGARSWVPTYMADTKPHGQVACDNFFACIEGDDLTPDLALGRISAWSPEEVASAVARIQRYVQGGSSGDWQKRVLLVADDDEAQFELDCDRAARLFEAAGLQAAKLYLRDQPSEKAMSEALLEHLSEGNLVTMYVGHAEPRSWAHEQILTGQQVESLQWADASTFVATFTCLDGAFQMGSEPCMAELFMRPPVGGAIACFSPTGLGYPDQHDVLAQALFKSLLEHADGTIGEAVMQAKRAALAKRADLAALVQMYVLFGDPALRLRISGTSK